MFLPYKTALIIGGPSKQTDKHKHKPKRYDKSSLARFYYRKKGHKVDDC